MTDRWSLNAQAEVAFRHWDGETAVHHLLSNDTHRLGEPAGWILERLVANSPLSIDAIATGSPYDTPDLAPALDALSRLGLIVRC